MRHPVARCYVRADPATTITRFEPLLRPPELTVTAALLGVERMRAYSRAALTCAALLSFLPAQAAPPFNVEVSPGVITRHSATDDLAFGRQVALSLQNERLIAAWADNSVLIGASDFDLAALRTTATAAGVTAGVPQNISDIALQQASPSVARNPLNPLHLVVVSDGGAPSGTTGTATLASVFRAVSRDGGLTWSSGSILPGHHSAEVGIDAAGNVFVLAIDFSTYFTSKAALYISTDGGETFARVSGFDPTRQALRPHLAVGRDSVWALVHDFDNNVLVVSRAPVTGLGAVGAFTGQSLAGSSGTPHADLALGPDGNAVVVYERTSAGIGTISAHRDPDGLGPQPFSGAIPITNFNPQSEIAMPRVAFDHSTGARRGRVYVIHQEEPRLSLNKEIHLRFSDDGGASWSAAIRLNDNAQPSQRIVPGLAIDSVNGNVAAIWYDFRGGSNTEARIFGTALAAPGKPAEPNSPLNLTTRSVSTSAIGLEWVDRSDNETGFVVERQGPSFFGGFTVRATTAPGATTFTDSGNPPQTSFRYRVRAINAAGSSAYSNEATGSTLAAAQPAPAAPTGLVARDTSTAYLQIDLSWTDTSSNELRFELERATNGGPFSLLQTLGENSTSSADSSLVRNQRYTYRVRSVNATGASAYSNVASVLLDGPSALTLQVVSASRIDLSWVDNSTREQLFRIERSRDGLSYSEIATVPANVTQFSDRNLRRNTRYFYRVRSQHAEGLSGYTNYSFATTSR